MKGVFCPRAGQIEVRETPAPEAGPGEVVVRVRACGICGSDLHFYLGHFPPPPSCTGHEAAGEVAEVGAEVRGIKEGDRVAIEPLRYCACCEYCRAGNYHLCPKIELYGIQLRGAHAEYVSVPATALFALPRSVDFPLGSLAEPLGAAKVFSDDRSDELVDYCESHPVDSVVEAVGGEAETVELASRCVRPGGTISLVGVLSRIPQLHPLFLIMREVQLVGSMTYNRFGNRADFELALDLLERQREAARRILTHSVPLDLAGEGYHTAADKTTGSIKVTVVP